MCVVVQRPSLGALSCCFWLSVCALLLSGEAASVAVTVVEAPEVNGLTVAVVSASGAQPSPMSQCGLLRSF